MNSELNILSGFIGAMRQFLQNMASSWDDCPKINSKYQQFMAVVFVNKTMHEMVCKEYHNQMLPYYDACINRNPAPFLDETIKFLREIDIKSKYQELTDPTIYNKEQVEVNLKNIWEYVDEMNKFSRLYNQIPRKLGSEIEKLALNLTEELTSGKKSFKDINWMSISKSLMGKADSSDINDFIKNLSGIYQAIGGAEGIKGVWGDNEAIPQIDELIKRAAAGGPEGEEVILEEERALEDQKKALEDQREMQALEQLALGPSTQVAKGGWKPKR